ncbi:MAG: glycosyltransferase [Chloroflexi bacterium]|nr:glycosyltransferase [Chloroflexota bacterium]MBV9898112.1 glycosyltransferase [Chloroflexota bacterium]
MRHTVAYVVSRFPLLTETFVLNEILALRAQGWSVELFAMRHERQTVAHAPARQLESSVRYASPHLALAADLRLVSKHPRVFADLVRTTVAGNVSSLRFLARTLLILPCAVAWAEQMRMLRVGHVHAHFGSYPAFVALIAAQLQGIGFSFTVHAHDLFADNVMLAEKVHRASFVVTISEFNRSRLAELVCPDDLQRVRVIHCGVDTKLFEFAPRHAIGNRHVVLSVAALREYKGLDNLIEACRLLRMSTPGESFVCQIVGEGPRRAALEQQIRASGLQGYVRLLGALAQDRVRELLAHADTFVLPSVVARTRYMDGIPVALMEAMASGVPVIASRLSGIPELVRDGETGLLVPPDRADAIHDAILRRWREPAQSAARAERARVLVEREFDLQENTGQLAELFVKHLAQPSVSDAHELDPRAAFGSA